ncbi:DUF882 domain-containing protein [Pelagibacterium sp. H642]|uniref:DUF882 domain-containing protein n=1 Tax=Pelagibacterium sp. H642 TaxID=1881069 RepID=UPI00281559D4|nr:DUF882 domain-containing protein [Pelagibacterium sp. H642]WMT89410.1 DUF882 domain-containing protein [Pelagibacterium sp. H642]
MLAAAIALASILPLIAPAQAANERELYLYYTHTKETIRIVYKRDGRFVQSALDRLNVFLRDWRRNEPAKMDPALFDLLWEVYQQSGASQPIHIVSAYRSPATNAMLASNSSGVADNSQHMKGKAIDFYIPGVPISTLRALGMRLQVGGVGYYPSSGSPFVHLDTASVRAWPRMTEAQLREIFPDGRTLHLPSNGRVLSQEGYRYAQAEWQRCHRVPCNAGSSMNGAIQVADGDRPRTLWDMITGGGNNDQPAAQQPAPQVVAAPAAPAPVQVAAAAASAPVQVSAEPPAPPARPADLIAGTMVADTPAMPETIPFQVIDAAEMTRQVAMADTGETDEAPLPPSMSRALAELRAETPSAYAPTGGGSLEVAAIQEAPVPQPRPQFTPAVAAAVQPQAAEPAELAIRPGFDAAIETASLEQPSELDAFASLFENATLPAAEPARADQATGNAMASLAVAEGELFAPELATVTDTMLAPVALASDHFAFEGQSDGSGAGEEIVAATGFTRTASLGPSSNGFGPAQTIWVHYDPQAN